METISRRSFYSAIVYGLGSLVGAALAVPSAIYLLAASKSQKNDWVEAADLTQLQLDKPKEVTFERTRIDGWRKFREKVIAWVVRTENNDVVAYSPQCTHLGCAYHWEDKQNLFVCPCHSSQFTIDGKVVAGPAARPLDRYDVRVDNGKLLIGSQIKRA